ncbi:MAG: hypothetical protein HY074_12075 [Deltaproteobacteria bacterium]|nr:hypothetical protein [Deltaproteobacteria bacterium]
MRFFWLMVSGAALVLASCAKPELPLASSGHRSSTTSKKQSKARLPDVGYLLNPSSLYAYRAVPGAGALEEIIRVGARALDWVDVLQKDVNPREREQIWRRLDRIGHEPVADAPLVYNHETIFESYKKAMASAPAQVVEVLRANSALPAMPPEHLSAKDIVVAVREIHTIYSRASRWLVLYQSRLAMSKANRDFRPWLKLRQKRQLFTSMTSRWAQLSDAEHERFTTEVADVCPLAYGEAATQCRALVLNLAIAKNGISAHQWLEALLQRGQREFDAKFGVREARTGVTISNLGIHRIIGVPVFGIDANVFGWLQERVSEGWSFRDAAGNEQLSVRLTATDDPGPEALKIEWETGALPHVNVISGDVVTMDSNTPRWLEHTQAVMRHEFGHILGFPDCYTEFWDEALSAFTNYALDSNDAMCALSGQFSDRHREALVRGYFTDKALLRMSSDSHWSAAAL